MAETYLNYGYTTYLPSVLFVGNDTLYAQRLKQQLEKHGCQIHQTKPSPQSLAAVGQNYFELIVLDLGFKDVDSCEICRQLSANPDLNGIPVVVLAACTFLVKGIEQLKQGRPVYCLPSEEAATPAILWQIIDERHYLTYRYL